MSLSEENIPTNLQELLTTLLKLSKNDAAGGSAVFKLGNEFVSLNISKLPDSSLNNPPSNLNKPNPIPQEDELISDPKGHPLELKNLISKDTFQGSPSPRSLKQNRSGSLKTVDLESDPLKFEDEKEETNIEGDGFTNFRESFENFPCHEMSFGRLSLIPRKNQRKESLGEEIFNFKEEKGEFEMKKRVFKGEEKLQEGLNLSKNQQNEKKIEEIHLHERVCKSGNKEIIENSIIVAEKDVVVKDEADKNFEKKECGNRIKETEPKAIKIEETYGKISENIRNALSFIESIQTTIPSPQEKNIKKPFSSNFLNEMKNIPVTDNNKINPYAFINLFSSNSTAKYPNEMISTKSPEEIPKQISFTKKNSNETEALNKTTTNISNSPVKNKKPGLISPNQYNVQKATNPISNNITQQPKPPLSMNTSPIFKKRPNNPNLSLMKPSSSKKTFNSQIKEKKTFEIKEVNEDAHSNEDVKSLKEKQGYHKNSADFEKLPLKNKESLEEKEKSSKSPLLPEEKKMRNQIENKEMDIPETEMEQNLKYLMEKADRSNETGEKMFQTINSLLKFKQHLEIKEKTLREKEKVYIEWEQKSKSSTQWSYDTKSTLNGTDPIKAILEEFYKEKKNEFFKNEQPSEADIHFLFLFSNPLITFFKDKEGKIGKRPIYNEIDIVNEWKTVQEILTDCKREIKFMKSSASLEKIGIIFDRNPRAIHFCGHGVKNNEENFGLVANEDVGDFLIFEDQFGAADFVSCLTLSKLLNKLKNKLQFAFVASCHSKFLGEVFLNAGAQHVICVKREEKILDKACQIFTKAFYNACFTGKKTICEAFEIAKEQIRANASLPKGEENKFVILIKRADNQSIFDEHHCSGWSELHPGAFHDLSWKPEFHHLPSQVENFVGRNEIMHEIITLILTHRFITIKGIPGIGKSSVVKEVGRYIYERNQFQNGIIYLQLISCQTNEAVTSCLDSKVFPNSSFKQIESKKENTLKMLYQIIDNLRNKEVLIIMDNVDMVLSNFSEKEKFQSTIDYLLSSCNNLKLLVTSRTPVGGVPLADCVERLYNLSHLNNEDAKNLFLMRSPRPISSQEISDLLIVIPSENFQDEDKNRKPKENTFSNHNFLELFGGHPQAITLGAALLYERSLKDLYAYLQSNSLVNVLHLDPYLSDREKKTFNSLKASLDASWAILYEKNKNAAKFFSVLGLLPGGASGEEFQAIWGENWQECCDALLRSSLIVKTQKNDSAFYSLFPFMTKYAEEHIIMKDKKFFHNKITEYYHKKIQKIFKMIGTLSTESSKAVDDLQDIEFNIRAVIFRELGFQGSKELEKSLYENYSNLNVSSIDNIKSASESLNNPIPNSKIEDSKEDEDFLPLTKENLEIHQKRYEFIVTGKALSSKTSKKSQRSTSPICINENLANYLKSPSKNNEEEDSEHKQAILNLNEESNRGKTTSVSDEENTKISGNEGKRFIESRLAIIPSESDKMPTKAFLKLNFDDNLNNESKTRPEPNNESKSESSTPRFSRLETPHILREEMIHGKGIRDLTVQNNEKHEIIDSENQFELNQNPEKQNENDDRNIGSHPENNEKNNSLTVATTEKALNSDKNNNQNSLGIPKKTPPLKEVKDNKKPPTVPKNSLSSATRPSGSLTNQEKPIKSKTSIPSSKPKNLSFKIVDKTKVELINKILIYYASTLFLLRRYNECGKMINHGLQISEKMNDRLAYANFKRISGSVQYIKKNFQQALKEFIEAEEVFSEMGCSLGISISEAAIGYIKYCEGEYNTAKNYLESALKIYDSLSNIFGIHFMNRWLANVKRKLPGFTTQSKKHIEAAQKILRDRNKVPTKNREKANFSVQNQHKGGTFILRWLGDGISIFMEVAFKIDVEGKKIKNKSSIMSTRTSNNQQINNNPQISASEEMMPFKNELQIPALVKSESQKKVTTLSVAVPYPKAKKLREEDKIEKKEEKTTVLNRPALLKRKK